MVMPLDLYEYGVLKGGGPPPLTFAQRLRALGVTSFLDSTSGATDDGTTSQWVDAILAGHVLVSQSTPSRLQYTGSINGLPAWRGAVVNGTNLVSTGDELASLILGITPFTQFFVRQGTGISTVYFAFGDTIGPDYDFKAGFNTPTLQSGCIRNSGGSVIAHVGSIATNTAPTIETYVFSGSDYQVFTDGAQATALQADALTMSWNRTCVGSTYEAGTSGSSWDGDIGDIVTYVGTITQATRWQIEALLSARWGIPVVQS